MSLTSRFLNAVNAFNTSNNATAKNTMNPDAGSFLRYGNKRPLYQDWSQVEMSDRDMYKDYPYAAITKRANRTATLGKNFLFTDASPSIINAAKKKDKEVVHPYLKIIRGSKRFSEKQFWVSLSTYLDLEGVYYLYAVRNVKELKNGVTKVGAVQDFIMMNPYQVRRVVKKSDGKLGGYVESKDGLYREIPVENVIEIKELNPFDNDEAYSMTDAAKNSQFTMQQAGDYARHSIKGNINSPGIITTDVELEDHIFDNFVSRIENHTKGEPLYGNGSGAVNWDSMQIDLDKAALDKITDINKAIFFAVAGVSDIMMGQQKAGTGRETSKTQKDDFTENAVMPRVEDIIDALNLDYRKYYPEWSTDKFEIKLDNPLESDRDAELKDIEIRTKEYEMVNQLMTLGYEFIPAARYAHGEISLQDLGEPTLEAEITDDEAEALARKELGISELALEEDGQDAVAQSFNPETGETAKESKVETA